MQAEETLMIMVLTHVAAHKTKSHDYAVMHATTLPDFRIALMKGSKEYLVCAF